MKKILISLTLAASVLTPLMAQAQETYPFRFNRITFDYTVQADGSIKVRELITVYYTTPFNMSWRGIPNSPTSSTTDFAVFDGETGQALQLSTTTLDGFDEASWGKYTVYEDAGATRIEWYYSTNKRVHTWVVSYTLRGAILPQEKQDGFNWNIFSGYQVPVDTVEGTVRLPHALAGASADLFSTRGHDYYIDRPDDKTFRFRVSDIQPGERVAVDVRWDKGELLKMADIPAVSVQRVPVWIYVVSVLAACALCGAAYYAGRRSRRG